MLFENEMIIKFDSLSQNESFARVVVASFVAGLDPTMEELADIKMAVSEAVTNAIIHGYDEYTGKISIYCKIIDTTVYIEIEDQGKGIADIDEARQPLFTTKPDEERSGMGFTVMETFMDTLEVESTVGLGTKVMMKKKLKSVKSIYQEEGSSL